MQSDFIFELPAIGLDLEEKLLTAIGYRLHVLVEVRGTKVGIEVGGLFQLLVSGNLTGSNMPKRRQVTALARVPTFCTPPTPGYKHRQLLALLGRDCKHQKQGCLPKKYPFFFRFVAGH